MENLNLIANLAQAVGLIVALLALFLSLNEKRDSQDLQIFIYLSDSFRKNWESEWELTLERVANYKSSQFTAEDIKSIRHMLNWIDWLGAIILRRKLNDEQIIFTSLGFTLVRIINVGRPIIENDILKFGLSYWIGLVSVAKKLKIQWLIEIKNEEDKKARQRTFQRN